MFNESFENPNIEKDNQYNEINNREITPEVEVFVKDVIDKFVDIARGSYSKSSVVLRELEDSLNDLDPNAKYEVIRMAEQGLKDRIEVLRNSSNVSLADRIEALINASGFFGIEVSGQVKKETTSIEDYDIKTIAKIEETSDEIVNVIKAENGSTEHVRFTGLSEFLDYDKNRSRSGGVSYIKLLRNTVGVVIEKLKKSNYPIQKIEKINSELNNMVDDVERENSGFHNN